jgi:hypothetical protein
MLGNLRTLAAPAKTYVTRFQCKHHGFCRLPGFVLASLGGLHAKRRSTQLASSLPVVGFVFGRFEAILLAISLPLLGFLVVNSFLCVNRVIAAAPSRGMAISLSACKCTTATARPFHAMFSGRSRQAVPLVLAASHKCLWLSSQ